MEQNLVSSGTAIIAIQQPSGITQLLSHNCDVSAQRGGAFSSSSMEINKVRVTVRYMDLEHNVCWYGEHTPSSTIEQAIRSIFRVGTDCDLVLKDKDGDVVAISGALPPGQTFTLEITGTGTGIGVGTGVTQRSESMQTWKIDEGFEQQSNSGDENEFRKKRRVRRKANEIDRSYKCPAIRCQRLYGSENALKMHIKLKHSRSGQDGVNKAPNKQRVENSAATPTPGIPSLRTHDLYHHPFTPDPYSMRSFGVDKLPSIQSFQNLVPLNRTL